LIHICSAYAAEPKVFVTLNSSKPQLSKGRRRRQRSEPARALFLQPNDIPSRDVLCLPAPFTEGHKTKLAGSCLRTGLQGASGPRPDRVIGALPGWPADTVLQPPSLVSTITLKPSSRPYDRRRYLRVKFPLLHLLPPSKPLLWERRAPGILLWRYSSPAWTWCCAACSG